jgi:acyl transferase domain-containing protein
LEAELAQRGVSGRRLRTSHAFHSPMMEPMLGEFERVLRGVKLSAPQLNYISNVTGGWVKAEEATDAAYWVEHARRGVRFDAGLETLLGGGERVVVEVGPGETLSGLARRRQLSERGEGSSEGIVVSTLGAKGGEEQEAVQRAVGMVWLGGVTIDWEQLRGGGRRRRVGLPTYPFERQRYWVGEGSAGRGGEEKQEPGEEKRRAVSEWFYLPSWKRALWPRGERIEAGERWVLLETAGDELSRQVREQLEQAVATVVRVRAGAAW